MKYNYLDFFRRLVIGAPPAPVTPPPVDPDAPPLPMTAPTESDDGDRFTDPDHIIAPATRSLPPWERGFPDLKAFG